MLVVLSSSVRKLSSSFVLTVAAVERHSQMLCLIGFNGHDEIQQHSILSLIFTLIARAIGVVDGALQFVDLAVFGFGRD